MDENIGIAQIDSVAGDFECNAKKITEYIVNAKKQGIPLLIFPKNALCGNMIENVADRHPILKEECKKWLTGIAAITDNITVILGFLCGSVAILRNGKIEKIIKELPALFENICITESEPLKADLIINMAQAKGKEILLMHSSSAYYAMKHNAPVVYVNSVGATDNVCYIGSSAVIGKSGQLIARAKAFEEQLLTVNLSEQGNIEPLPVTPNENKEFSPDYEADLERTYKTLIQGIKGYFSKCGLKRAVLGLSGGLDSTVCAVLLSEALGKENVLGISMPSEITTVQSKSDAKILADNLGINFAEAPIKSMVTVVTECFGDLFDKINWKDRYKKSFTQDNIQARLRAMYLYGVSNEFPSCIPIATSDKSESYMGYATINGDMSGGFAPIADITKTKLFALARWINNNVKNVIPESVLIKRPGAELAIDPKTGKPLIAEDALMPYDFLDEIIWRIENNKESYNDFMNTQFIYEKNNVVSKEQKTEWLDKFYGRMSSALYKWSIMPPSILIDSATINKSVYYQPVTSGRINFKGTSEDEILKICKKEVTNRCE